MKIFLKSFILLSILLNINGCDETRKTPQAKDVQQQESAWKSGFGQGTTEYFVENGPGNQIYIACPEDRPASVSVTLIGKEADESKNEKLIFIIDSKEYSYEYQNADCRVCGENFVFFWGKLRDAKTLSVRFSDSVKSEFSVTNLKTLLPEFEKSSCLLANQM
jgi:hypothetical protein